MYRDMNLRVYISSTVEDLMEERAAAKDVIQRHAIVSDSYRATDTGTVTTCTQDAGDADIYVGIIGHRYGWVPEGDHSSDAKSITELEYDACASPGKEPVPRLIFLKTTTHQKFSDAITQRVTADHIRRFRERVKADQQPLEFNTVAELREGLLGALIAKIHELRSRAVVAATQRLRVGVIDDQIEEAQRIQGYFRVLVARHQSLQRLSDSVPELVDGEDLAARLERWSSLPSPDRPPFPPEVPNLLVCDAYMGRDVTVALLFRIVRALVVVNDMLRGDPYIGLIMMTAHTNRASDEALLRRLDGIGGEMPWLARVQKPVRGHETNADSLWIDALRAIELRRAHHLSGNPFVLSEPVFAGATGQVLWQSCDLAMSHSLVAISGRKEDGAYTVGKKLVAGLALGPRTEAIEIFPTTISELTTALAKYGGATEAPLLLGLQFCDYDDGLAAGIQSRFAVARRAGCRIVALCNDSAKWSALLSRADALPIVIPTLALRVFDLPEASALLRAMGCNFAEDEDELMRQFAQIVRDTAATLEQVQGFFADSRDARHVTRQVIEQLSEWIQETS